MYEGERVGRVSEGARDIPGRIGQIDENALFVWTANRNLAGLEEGEQVSNKRKQ